jgi:hypothetical protein
MSKYVIETVQVIRRKYYVKVKDPGWAEDALVFDELEHFSSSHHTEDVIGVTKVGKFPKALPTDNVNAAVMTFSYDDNMWFTSARWDLADLS